MAGELYRILVEEGMLGDHGVLCLLWIIILLDWGELGQHHLSSTVIVSYLTIPQDILPAFALSTWLK